MKTETEVNLKSSLYKLITLKDSQTVYISGPITDIPDLNKPEFLKYEKALLALGYNVINPHNITAHLDISKFTWEDFMTIDIPFLLICENVVCLDGWQSSKGARLEIALAYFMKKKIYVAKNMQPLEYHFELKPIMKKFLT